MKVVIYVFFVAFALFAGFFFQMAFTDGKLNFATFNIAKWCLQITFDLTLICAGLWVADETIKEGKY